MKTTECFRASVLIRRPYLQMQWIRQVLSDPLRVEVQDNGRVRRWGFIPEAGKYL